MDHSETGAVPLLGVGGPVFIGHGSSSAKSIRSALRGAKTFVDARVNEAIERQVRELASGGASNPTGSPAEPPSAERDEGSDLGGVPTARGGEA